MKVARFAAAALAALAHFTAARADDKDSYDQAESEKADLAKDKLDAAGDQAKEAADKKAAAEDRKQAAEDRRQLRKDRAADRKSDRKNK